MLYFRLPIVLFISFLAVGCAIAPESLKESTKKEVIVIDKRISTVAFRGLNVRCEEGALPGTYTAKKEDKHGTYFYGEGRSIWYTNEIVQVVPRLHVGGIYIPNDKSKAPQFFYFFETDVHTTENVDNYVQSRIAAGNITSTGGASVPVGANVVGNVVGGAIVNAMIQSDVGKIIKFPAIEDKLVADKIISSKKSL